MSKKGLVILIIIIILIIVGIVYAMSAHQAAAPATDTTGQNTVDMNDMNMNGQGATTTMATTTDATGTTTDANVKVFTVVGSNFAFAPKTITVNKGDTVKIIFQNSGGTHDLKIDEFNVATPRIQTGQTATVQFVADKTGTFQYYC